MVKIISRYVTDMRFALGIEYIGTDYYGFQNQLDAQLPTIQEKLESAISKIANHPVSIVTAGRTDRGVHATGQVIHFDTDAIRSDYKWILGINTYLPKDICVRWIKSVAVDFHARFSAVARTYQYKIFNSSIRSALFHQRATLYHARLDENIMHESAQYFVGEHDFTSFRSIGCQAKNPIRTISYFNITRQDHFVILDVKANAFLHHMVRNMAGLLLDIGSDKKSPDCIPEILASCDRTQASITAPAEGLYLTQVDYPVDYKVLFSSGGLGRTEE